MSTIISLWQRGMKAFLRNRTGLILSIIMPLFFVFVFGSMFTINGIENPIAYMLAGVIIVGVFDSSLTIASSTIDDIVSGFMKEVLVSPAKRVHVALGQILSATTVATVQGLFLLVIGFFLGIKFTAWQTPIYILLAMICIGIVFSGVGLFLATIVKSGQTFQIVRMAIAMPMTFISGAYMPLSVLPKILRPVAYLNPMTYATALFRMILLEKTGLPTQQLIQEGLLININGFVVTPLLSLLIIAVIGVVFLSLSTLSFNNTDFSKSNRSATDSNEIWG